MRGRIFLIFINKIILILHRKSTFFTIFAIHKITLFDEEHKKLLYYCTYRSW